MRLVDRWRRGSRRRRWIVALAVIGVGLGIGLFALTNWPGSDIPLVRLFRRDQTWEQMQRRHTWRVGLDPSFPPFELLDAAGTPVGLDVDLARALAAEWGIRAEIVPIGFDSLPDALRAARVDSILSAYPYDERLTRDFGFSQPYFDAGLQLAVHTGSSVRDAADLDGKRVAVEWGSTGDMVGRRWQREGKAVELVRFETPDAVLTALLAGAEVDAALVDNVSLRQAQAQGAPLIAVGPVLESTPYVVVTPIRASDLQQQLAQTLDRLAQDGTLEALERKWFAVRAE